MRKLSCWLGHKWKVIKIQPRWELWMMHLCCNVGTIRECTRCGEILDFTNPNIDLWGPILEPDKANEWWQKLEKQVMENDCG